MNDKIKRHRDDEDFTNCFGFPPFKMFWKSFPGHKHSFIHKGLPLAKCGNKYSYGHRYPKTNVNRDSDGYEIDIELPGISKDNISLEITSEELWLRASNEEFNKEYEAHMYFKKLVKIEEVKANLKLGILTIKIPYLDKEPKTKVKVE
jgi:HSP20 family molecular chaperone IbpA